LELKSIKHIEGNRAEILVAKAGIYANGKKLATRDVVFHARKEGAMVFFHGAEGLSDKPAFWCGVELFNDTFGPDWSGFKKEMVKKVKTFFDNSGQKRSVKDVVEEEREALQKQFNLDKNNKPISVFRRGLDE